MLLQSVCCFLSQIGFTPYNQCSLFCTHRTYGHILRCYFFLRRFPVKCCLFHSPCAKEEGWVIPIPPSPESSDIPQDDPEGSLVGITQNALDLSAYLFPFILHATAPFYRTYVRFMISVYHHAFVISIGFHKFLVSFPKRKLRHYGRVSST